MKKSAIKSSDGKYRYCLKREWDRKLQTIVFIGLNPSLADAVNNDATICRCIKFAQRWGYGSLVMLNLFAYITVDPRVLFKVSNPIGEDNDKWLKKYRYYFAIACWGNHGHYYWRNVIVTRFFDRLYCLGKTKMGQPKHPLYQPANLTPVIYREE